MARVEASGKLGWDLRGWFFGGGIVGVGFSGGGGVDVEELVSTFLQMLSQ